MLALTQSENFYPPWSPRIWNGMRWVAYWRLLLSHHLRIHPFKWPMTALGAGCALMNSALRPWQAWFCDRQIMQTDLTAPPVFIIGHWRSGTTLLHELLTLDENVTCPTTLDAFIPNHLLVSQPWLRPLVNLLLPRQRPMDNMMLAGNSPQEDDFALISLGAATPYSQIAFPNDRLKEETRFDPAELTEPERDRLHRGLDYFYRSLTFRGRKRLVLKSPPHTARVAALARWFPGAKFVHLSRHPYQLVRSTQTLWRSLDATQGFQLPTYQIDELRDYIHRCQEKLYTAYLRDRVGLAPGQLIEIKFEDLVSEPDEVLKSVLAQLEWPLADKLLNKAASYFQQHQDHQPSTTVPEPTVQAEIAQRWSKYMQCFGYQA